jgi:predicted Zn-dependent protease
MKTAAFAIVVLVAATPAFAQFGKLGDLAGKASRLATDLNISEQEERDLGERVSATVRTEFGVVQDAAVTKYVSLLGYLLAKASSRPGLKWEFIVLDTDGVKRSWPGCSGTKSRTSRRSTRSTRFKRTRRSR